MLQKGFFITKSFNWAGKVLVNLSGSQQFIEDTIFPKGVYLVDAVAGSTFDGTGPTSPMANVSLVGGKVYTEVTIQVPFIIRAYCGSKGGYGVGGTNPYTGEFKVNAWTQQANVPSVNHIFGNAGAGVRFVSQYSDQFYPGSGNCLGNGVGVNTANNEKYGIGAGSCIHFLPEGGTFGTDYIFAAHCGPCACRWRGSPFFSAGCGGVYGGGAGSLGNTAGGSYPDMRVWNGGSTPYGNGGTGTVVSRPPLTGADGEGIGAGKIVTFPTRGSAAFFKDGEWATSSDSGEKEQDGHIIVTFVRPI